MRTLVLLSVAALVCLPLAGASPIPVLSINLDRSSQDMNATNASQVVTFNGEVVIEKSAFLTANVTLAGSVDRGWQTEVSPAAMTFTTTDPQRFSCTVIVPAATPGNTSAKLYINGTIVSGLLRSDTSTSAAINILGTSTSPANQTGNNTNNTKPPDGDGQNIIPPIGTTKGKPGFLSLTYEQWAITATGTIAAFAGIGLFVRMRRRR